MAKQFPLQTVSLIALDVLSWWCRGLRKIDARSRAAPPLLVSSLISFLRAPVLRKARECYWCDYSVAQCGRGQRLNEPAVVTISALADYPDTPTDRQILTAVYEIHAQIASGNWPHNWMGWEGKRRDKKFRSLARLKAANRAVVFPAMRLRASWAQGHCLHGDWTEGIHLEAAFVPTVSGHLGNTQR